MTLPLLLAGPILRRVEPQLVCVWLATSAPVQTTLTVWRGLRNSTHSGGTPLFVAPPVAARRFGERLFLTLITHRPATPLQPGENHAYDLELALSATVKHTLKSLGLLGLPGNHPGAAQPWPADLPLGYAPGLLPSFALPPATLTDLNIVYGSCRRSANAHPDAMPWIDALIEAEFKKQPLTSGDLLPNVARLRPHQLFLGGDQIYADDVSPVHIDLCNRLGHELLSGTPQPTGPQRVETLQVKGTLEKAAGSTTSPQSVRLGLQVNEGSATSPVATLPATLDRFLPGGRLDLTLYDAQFTSSDGDSHLLSFGEFAAMYLSVWSPVCWDSHGLPDPAALAEGPGALGDGHQVPLRMHSLMDLAVAGFLSAGQWEGWNDVHPRSEDGDPDAQDFSHLFARHLIDTWLPQHAGFEHYKALKTSEDFSPVLSAAALARLKAGGRPIPGRLREHMESSFHLFMRQMQARVVRLLVHRFGVLALTRCAVVRGLPAHAIRAQAKTEQDAYDNGGADLWINHLTGLVGAGNWKALVKAALKAPPPGPALPENPKPTLGGIDEPLGDALIDKLAEAWADDPPDLARRQAFDEEGYANLGLHALGQRLKALATGKVWPIYMRLRTHHDLLKSFAAGLPRVQRALANVPTYMIFDDHDVTDDWNLNPMWAQRVFRGRPEVPFPSGNPLGRQIVRNALASYAVFQDWGNDPARHDTPTGLDLLAQVGKLFPASGGTWPNATAAKALDKLFGLDKQPTRNAATGRYAPVDAPVSWHYSVGGPRHLAVVLDNRTRRSFASELGPPGNVATEMLERQIPAGPLADGRVLLVVAPLQVLAPSVFDEIVAPGSYRAFDMSGRVFDPHTKGIGYEGMAGTNPDAIEGWALDPPSFEALLERLAPHKQVVLLSGDVHYSAATQMSYWSPSLLGSALPARLVQFTSSGIKNVMPGYLVTIDHSLSFAQMMVRADLGGERMGWKAGATGAFSFPPGKTQDDVPFVVRKRIAKTPAYLPVYGWPMDRSDPTAPKATRVLAQRKPDFSWRLKPVFDVRTDAQRARITQPVLLRPESLQETSFKAAGSSAVAAYSDLARRHLAQLDRLGNSRFILFHSNIGRVRFAQAGASAPLEAVHEVLAVVRSKDVDLDPQLDRNLPAVVMEQRARLTPDPAEKAPEDLDLKPPLARALQDQLQLR